MAEYFSLSVIDSLRNCILSGRIFKRSLNTNFFFTNWQSRFFKLYYSGEYSQRDRIFSHIKFKILIYYFDEAEVIRKGILIIFDKDVTDYVWKDAHSNIFYCKFKVYKLSIDGKIPSKSSDLFLKSNTVSEIEQWSRAISFRQADEITRASNTTLSNIDRLIIEEQQTNIPNIPSINNDFISNVQQPPPLLTIINDLNSSQNEDIPTATVCEEMDLISIIDIPSSLTNSAVDASILVNPIDDAGIGLHDNLVLWMINEAYITPALADKYANNMLENGIGSVNKLSKKVLRDKSILTNILEMDEDDADGVYKVIISTS